MSPINHVATHLESKKKLSRHHTEVWRARDLMPILGYADWENFSSVIRKAMESCTQVGMEIRNHFSETTAMVKIGSGAKKQVADWYLTRHACNLIAMNGDSSKPVIAAAQAYFSMQTHKQEALERISEEERRLILRNRVKDGNVRLNAAASDAGVTKFAIFHDAGYKVSMAWGKPPWRERRRSPMGKICSTASLPPNSRPTSFA